MQDQNQKPQPNPVSSSMSAATPIDLPDLPDLESKPSAPVSVPGLKAAQEDRSTTKDKTTKAPDVLGDPLKSAPGIIPRADFERRIIDKIQKSENILVALSRDPSVDEIAAAIGLTLFLDSLQKHTTAIFSGQVPDALQFLQPDDTFETNTDSLQDFIIALSKDKADHLRYKLEGDFVKVYITPYKTVITENDLEFSRGDYNVDLVLALGVPTANDLDAALSEHGRIMHDSTIVDITCDTPGKFAEIEWSDEKASSVSEMVAKLLLQLKGKDGSLDQAVATALLTGVVAATGRFSNSRTSSETLELASKLMTMGADQQLIAAHVMANETPMAAQFDALEPATAEPFGPAPLPEVQPAVPDTPVVVVPDIMPAMPLPAVETPPVIEPEPMPEPEPEPAPIVPEGPKDYAAMVDAALAEPAAMNLPPTSPAPVIQPAVNIAQMPDSDADQVVLPPPPMPPTTPTNMDTMMPPVLPPVQPQEHPVTDATATPDTPVVPASPAVPEPGAFRIPGM